MSRNEGTENTSAVSAIESQIPNDQRRRLYEYIRDHGPVCRSELRRTLFPNDPHALRLHLDQLDRCGLIETDEHRVEVSFDLSNLAPKTEVELPSLGDRLELRPANRADRPALSELVQTVSTERPQFGAQSLVEPLISGTGIGRWDSNVGALYVATLDGTICGWAHVRRERGPIHDPTALLSGGVDPSYREGGIGTELHSYVVDWARTRDFVRLSQSLPATNETAIAFLRDRGWDIEARLVDRYRIDDTLVDEVVVSRACE